MYTVAQARRMLLPQQVATELKIEGASQSRGIEEGMRCPRDAVVHMMSTTEGQGAGPRSPGALF